MNLEEQVEQRHLSHPGRQPLYPPHHHQLYHPNNKGETKGLYDVNKTRQHVIPVE